MTRTVVAVFAGNIKDLPAFIRKHHQQITAAMRQGKDKKGYKYPKTGDRQ